MKPTQKDSFGTRLKRYRRAAGLTQEDLAERVNVSASTIWQYESDLRKPKIGTVAQYATVLGITPGDLMPADSDLIPNQLKPMPQILRKRMNDCICKCLEEKQTEVHAAALSVPPAYRIEEQISFCALPQTPHPAAPLRLWHVDLLPYLPDALFRQQEKALLAVMRAVRDDSLHGNVLVDYVREMPRRELYSYFLEYAYCYTQRYGKLVDNQDEWIAFSDKTYVRRPFADWQCLDELRMCMAVLMEWYVYDRGPSKITADDWCRLLDGYKTITGEEYKV